ALRPGHGRERRPLQLRSQLDRAARQGRVHRSGTTPSARSRQPSATLRRPGLGPRQIPRHGMTVRSGGEAVGEVTSGGFSFSLGHGIATAYVAPHLAGAPLTVDLRGEAVPADRVPLPFYRRGRSEGREPQAFAPSGGAGGTTPRCIAAMQI